MFSIKNYGVLKFLLKWLEFKVLIILFVSDNINNWIVYVLTVERKIVNYFRELI